MPRDEHSGFPEHPTPAGARRPRWMARLALLVALAVTLGGCQGLFEDEPQRAEGPEHGVPMEVVTGPDGSALAFVDIYIRGQGPYTMVLDTGASRSVISPEIVEELGLPLSGETAQVTGVTGQAEVELVEVDDWSLGDETLPAATIVSHPLPQMSGPSFLGEIMGTAPLQNMQGLLGSDVLRQFGAVTVDYQQGLLILRPGAEDEASAED
jgi:hypothetical protein